MPVHFIRKWDAISLRFNAEKIPGLIDAHRQLGEEAAAWRELLAGVGIHRIFNQQGNRC